MKAITVNEDKFPELFVDYDYPHYVPIPVTALLQTGKLYFKPNDSSEAVQVFGIGFIKSGMEFDLIQLEDGTLRIDARSQKDKQACFSGEFPVKPVKAYSKVSLGDRVPPETFTLKEVADEPPPPPEQF